MNMFCHKCGKETEESTKFCHSCGEALQETASHAERGEINKSVYEKAHAKRSLMNRYVAFWKALNKEAKRFLLAIAGLVSIFLIVFIVHIIDVTKNALKGPWHPKNEKGLMKIPGTECYGPSVDAVNIYCYDPRNGQWIVVDRRFNSHMIKRKEKP